MSKCDICMRDVDDGVACGDCSPSPEEERRIATERIVADLRRRAKTLDVGWPPDHPVEAMREILLKMADRYEKDEHLK